MIKIHFLNENICTVFLSIGQTQDYNACQSIKKPWSSCESPFWNSLLWLWSNLQDATTLEKLNGLRLRFNQSVEVIQELSEVQNTHWSLYILWYTFKQISTDKLWVFYHLLTNFDSHVWSYQLSKFTFIQPLDSFCAI